MQQHQNYVDRKSPKSGSCLMSARAVTQSVKTLLLTSAPHRIRGEEATGETAQIDWRYLASRLTNCGFH